MNPKCRIGSTVIIFIYTNHLTTKVTTSIISDNLSPIFKILSLATFSQIDDFSPEWWWMKEIQPKYKYEIQIDRNIEF